MEQAIAHQTAVFLWSAALGAVFGLAFDFFRCLRKALEKGRAFQSTCDIIFCLLCLALFLLFMLTVADGRFRSYIPAGVIMGMFLYFALLGRLMRGWMLPLLRLLRKSIALAREGVLRSFSYPRGN